jgi:hypothetical protein
MIGRRDLTLSGPGLVQGQVCRFIVYDVVEDIVRVGRAAADSSSSDAADRTPFPTPFLLTDGVDWRRPVSLWCD